MYENNCVHETKLLYGLCSELVKDISSDLTHSIESDISATPPFSAK